MMLHRLKSAITREERNKLNENFGIIETLLNALKNQMNNVVASAGKDNSENVAARTNTTINKSYTSVGDRLDEEYAAVQAKFATKADQSFVDAQFASIVSGSPKGTFTDYTALVAKYPQGAEGTMLVLADGHWYYWNSTTNEWEDGGLYQAQGIADGAIARKELSHITIKQMMKENNLFPNDTAFWKNGTFDSDGNETTSNIRIISDFIVITDRNSVFRFTPPEGMSYDIFYYDENKNFLGNRGYSTTPYEAVLLKEYAYLRLRMFYTSKENDNPFLHFDGFGEMYTYPPFFVNGLEWECGAIVTAGAENVSLTRIKSKPITYKANEKILHLQSVGNTAFHVDVYNLDGTHKVRLNGSNFVKKIDINLDYDCTLRITMRYDGDEVVTDRLSLANMLLITTSGVADNSVTLSKIADSVMSNFVFGGINDYGVLNNVNTRARSKIQIDKDAMLSLNLNDSNCQYSLRVFKDGVQLQTQPFTKRDSRHFALAGYEYYVVLKYDNDAIIDLSTIKNVLTVKVHAPQATRTTLKVASHNVGMFGYGVGAGVPDGEAEKISEWRDFLANKNIDIYLMQEFAGYIDAARTIRTQDFYGNWYNNIRTVDAASGVWQGILSKYPLFEQTEMIELPNTLDGVGNWGNRKLSKTYCYVDGKKIALFNAHLIPGNNDAEFEQRRLHHLQIIEELKKEKYFILAGDFNPWKDTRYTQPYLDTGFKVALLGDFFPSFNTCLDDTICIDNVIVSGNINIDNIDKSEYMTSDHRAVIATLTID